MDGETTSNVSSIVGAVQKQASFEILYVSFLQYI